jgi:hypothetical protein
MGASADSQTNENEKRESIAKMIVEPGRASRFQEPAPRPPSAR